MSSAKTTADGPLVSDAHQTPSNKALPLALPLTGCQLIEASAGTGKTFTIALLYVRLVLGHGQPGRSDCRADNGFSQPLVPPDILVVTFTEAASQELRERIRARLVQAAEAFRADPAHDDDLAGRDPLLAELRNDFAPEAWPICARRLILAAEWMDDAAISTIHSWCQRMLKEHAFDSGKLFRQEVIQDMSELTQEAVNDYWRTRVYPLSEPLAASVVELFSSPQELYSNVRNLLARDDAALMFCGEPLVSTDLTATLTTFSDHRAKADSLEAQARQRYLDEAQEVRNALQALRPSLNGNSFRGKDNDETFAGWLEELDHWAQGGIATGDTKFVQKLARSRLKVKKGVEVPDIALFDALEEWGTYQQHADDLKRELLPQFLADASRWISQRLREQLEASALMGFNDMITGLAEALDGEGGDALARRIRQQFPVAMIDEFQDTDPAQYHIFECIYRIDQANAKATEDASIDAADDPSALVLIGDPKQAIYGFRGGDIYTYLAARQATLGHHHSLDTNFRSSHAAVDSVNQLFAFAEQHHERGAFRFADATGQATNPLPFVTVKANGRKETLMLDGQPATALTGWLVSDDDSDSGCLNKERYLREAAHHCANRIAEWLNQSHPEGGEPRAGFARPGDDRLTPLNASDIAILVRDRVEATAIRRALSQRGLASVYLSDRDSVFATAEARDMLYWLKAIAHPESVSTLRTALATATLGLSLAELDHLQRDESAWERVQERFMAYRQRWQRRGVLPALRKLMHDYRIPARLLNADQGQRRLTNLLHLAEWAQQASDTLDGDHALIRLLSEHVQEPADDEQILRLESDAELIQVVTIFKSKGLEYPVVCLPFLCTYKEVSGKTGTPLYHLDDRPVLELAPKKEMAKEGFELADDERLSEEVRLIYVALTRARHASFIGLAPLKYGNGKAATLHKSALGHLLAGGANIPDEQSLRACWQQMQGDSGDVLLETAPSSVASPIINVVPRQSTRAHKPALSAAHQAFAPWWIASYSALAQKGATAPETPAAEVLEEEDSDQRQAVSRADTRQPEPGSLHAFPRGPGPGTFLHGVLEAMAEHGFAAAVGDTTLQARMAQRCRRRGWDDHIDALTQGMQRWLTTPLSPAAMEPPGATSSTADVTTEATAELTDGLTLCELSRYRAEPDFWFATHNAITPAMDRLARDHLFPGAPRPQLGFQRLNGLLKGFIDLLAEHDGRFYVIDWKSNWLGPDDAAYHPDAMRDAMLDKRYDMQLALYLVALHRHLRQTLPDYDYEQHVGGAMLVFLRGINAPSRGVAAIKPPLAFIEALDRCLAGERQEETLA
ncbi:exodeoxyribonuclease V subunit beta [Halomonas sp. DP8Y7-3]|uniref:exodeoxyribonuclease V subunit beta n=1 Tax=Halomonas sp. DP8Y7-3 TaxID=2859079 RepID=UPI001C97CA93|nr:exodeoxyribonuclease V subunit beta [Halomonas sp. DP8Y7-3]MBY5929283.1 exodeoxyribonuclease V subunit beta [Halomonas sp. DP8Y7-3]